MQDDEQIRLNYVSLREHIEQRLKDSERAMAEARRLMEEKLRDFPEQFQRKGEMGETFATMRSDIRTLLTFMNRAEGLASKESVNQVRWIAVSSLVTSIVMSTLGLILRFLQGVMEFM